MTKKERGNFGSKLGVILASAGQPSDWAIYGDSLMKREIMEELLLFLFIWDASSYSDYRL